MSEYEYEEQNLDDFLIKSSKILISEGNDDEKGTIIESLKQHLSSIFNNQFELQNFYKTLNMVIFNKNLNKIINRQCFKIYPLIFSFNPNSCFKYIDFYLLSLHESIKEENKADFTYLGLIFSEVITLLFSKEKKNNNLLSKSYSLGEKDKYKLYNKLFKFLKEKIQSPDKIEQSFGCLLLTELIEKCPIIKEQRYLEEIFKLLSENLEDKKFQCKLDILNCLISLIFITEQGFKSYANLCLFRVLDYLTNEQWIMRKLSVNIVYTLVFFCKEEILPVKDNIVEFLNILKEDPVKEIREVCQQILNLLEDENKENNKLKVNGNNFKNSEDKIIGDFDDKKEKDKGIIEDVSLNKEEHKDNEDEIKLNRFVNKSKHISNTDKKYKLKKNSVNNKMENGNKNKSDKNIINNRNKNSNIINCSISTKSRSKRTPIKNQIKVVPKNNHRIKARNCNNKNEIEDIKIYDSPSNVETKNNSGNKNENFEEKEYQNNIMENALKPKSEIKNDYIKESFKNENEKEKDINNIEENKEKEKEDETFEKTLENIMGQLGKIQEGQLHFLNMINDLQTKLNNNYDNLNERIIILEKNYNDNKNIPFRTTKKGRIKIQNFEELKNKFRLGKYNEALNDAIHNEKNLFKILPLIDKNNISKMNNDIMEDVINILNKKLILINLENGRTILNDILSFYMCLIKTKFPLKLITQLNIKDSLVMFKNKNNDRLLQIDINNIDAIVKSLKV